jgi:EAL domain-containing protein (putative c-di-GMP-specific phosphodiesterase class I)
MGMVVLRRPCEQQVAWDERQGAVTWSPSTSVRGNSANRLRTDVMAVLDLTGANPARLALEITESLLVDDFGSIVDKMNALRQLGIGFSLDDFGTGYSSLSYLKRLPLQELKIDSSFVRDVLLDTNDATIVRAVVAMGHELGLEVVAEGVETQPQLDFLMACGCRFYQGFFFARPMPENEFERYLATPQPQDALA